MTKSDFKGKKKGGKPAGPPKRRPPPGHPARWGADGKPQGRKGDVEKKKKSKTLSLTQVKRSKYLEKLEAYSGKKKTTTQIAGQKHNESDKDYHLRVKTDIKTKLAEINKPSGQIKKAEKRKEYLKKKDTKNKKKKEQKRLNANDSDSDLDEERTILDGPRKKTKVEFERPAFGDVIKEPPRDLKEIAAKMIAKQSLTRFAEKVTGEKFNKDIKRVVIPDVGLKTSEEIDAEQKNISTPELIEEELTEEEIVRRQKKLESKRRREESRRAAEEEAQLTVKANAIADENRILYAKFNLSDLINQSKVRIEKKEKKRSD